jgi:hypothetical protein
MATFTTWTALLTSMLNDLASGNVRVTEVTIGDKTIRYTTLKDLREHIEYVRTMASFETGTASPRTYAGQGGRG